VTAAILRAGARTFLVNGLITDCGRIVAEGRQQQGWFDVSTLKEPYRIEGKKTMGYEVAEQFGWELPDAIFYPTGGGVGLIGMWKAFDELETRWIGAKTEDDRSAGDRVSADGPRLRTRRSARGNLAGRIDSRRPRFRARTMGRYLCRRSRRSETLLVTTGHH
jgi:threonine synthase